MNFKPTKKKIIYSLAITLAWYFILFIINGGTMCRCAPRGFENCIDYNYLSPLQGGCHCGCTSLLTVVYLYFLTLILPFCIVYFIMSMKQK